jgi:hypothetical protein
MLCKDIKLDYRILKSKEAGLLDKIRALDKLIAEGNLLLLDKLIAEQTTAREEFYASMLLCRKTDCHFK